MTDSLKEHPHNAYARRIESDKAAADALNSEGERLFAEGKLELALVKFGEAIKRYSNEAIYYSNLAVVLHATGQSEEAWNYTIEALHLDASLPAARENLIDIASALGKQWEAAEILQLFPGQ